MRQRAEGLIGLPIAESLPMDMPAMIARIVAGPAMIDARFAELQREIAAAGINVPLGRLVLRS
jgi:hypothetical protein